jgi:hypothetical protein
MNALFAMHGEPVRAQPSCCFCILLQVRPYCAGQLVPAIMHGVSVTWRPAQAGISLKTLSCSGYVNLPSVVDGRAPSAMMAGSAVLLRARCVRCRRRIKGGLACVSCGARAACVFLLSIDMSTIITIHICSEPCVDPHAAPASLSCSLHMHSYRQGHGGRLSGGSHAPAGHACHPRRRRCLGCGPRRSHSLCLLPVPRRRPQRQRGRSNEHAAATGAGGVHGPCGRCQLGGECAGRRGYVRAVPGAKHHTMQALW